MKFERKCVRRLYSNNNTLLADIGDLVEYESKPDGRLIGHVTRHTFLSTSKRGFWTVPFAWIHGYFEPLENSSKQS